MFCHFDWYFQPLRIYTMLQSSAGTLTLTSKSLILKLCASVSVPFKSPELKCFSVLLWDRLLFTKRWCFHLRRRWQTTSRLLKSPKISLSYEECHQLIGQTQITCHSIAAFHEREGWGCSFSSIWAQYLCATDEDALVSYGERFLFFLLNADLLRLFDKTSNIVACS